MTKKLTGAYDFNKMTSLIRPHDLDEMIKLADIAGIIPKPRFKLVKPTHPTHVRVAYIMLAHYINISREIIDDYLQSCKDFEVDPEQEVLDIMNNHVEQVNPLDIIEPSTVAVHEHDFDRGNKELTMYIKICNTRVTDNKSFDYDKEVETFEGPLLEKLITLGFIPFYFLEKQTKFLEKNNILEQMKLAAEATRPLTKLYQEVYILDVQENVDPIYKKKNLLESIFTRK